MAIKTPLAIDKTVTLDINALKRIDTASLQVISAFVPQQIVGQAPQLGIQHGQEFFQGFGIAAVPAIEAARKLTIAGSPFGSTVAIRSPGPSPSAARAPAIVMTCSLRFA